MAWHAPEVLMARNAAEAQGIDALAKRAAYDAPTDHADLTAPPVTELADVYSFGITCYEVVLRTIPFKGKPSPFQAATWPARCPQRRLGGWRGGSQAERPSLDPQASRARR